MKKIIYIIMVAVLAFSFIPQASFASSETSVISPSEVKADLNSLADIQVVASVADSVYLNSVTNGTGTLIPGTDYKVSGSTVIIKKSYLAYYFGKFEKQNLYLKFNFSDGSSSLFTVYTGTTPHPEFGCISKDFNPGAASDIKFPLEMNGNFIASVKCDAGNLVQKLDFTYSNDAHELIIRKGFLASQFKKSSNPLSLVVGFTGDKPQTITINCLIPANSVKSDNSLFDLMNPGDITITISGNKLSSISSEPAAGFTNSDYFISGNTVIIKKSFLKDYFTKYKEHWRRLNLKFDFEEGDDITLTITRKKIFKMISAGGNVEAAIEEDGSVFTWGISIMDAIPDFVPGYVIYRIASNAKAVSTENGCVLVLKEDGTVTGFGFAYDLQMPPNDLGGIKQVSVGVGYAAALKEDGSVILWGRCYSDLKNIAELTGVKSIAQNIALKEDGTIVNYYSGYPVFEGISKIKTIASGPKVMAALKEDGTVVINWYGSMSEPEVFRAVRAIAVGESHVLALKEDGTVVAWGDNSEGQCNVPEGLKGIKAIAAGYNISMALKEDGSIVTWGREPGEQWCTKDPAEYPSEFPEWFLQ
ncbi:MAG TPA: X2-like carbohydrate binding domain-containing protein [Clostridia bacterium]